MTNKPEEMFLDAAKIKFIGTTANSSSFPYMDFTFEEGNICSEAVLTYNVVDEAWHAVILTSEDSESDFDEGVDATEAQLNALKEKLPENAQEIIAQFTESNASPKI